MHQTKIIKCFCFSVLPPTYHIVVTLLLNYSFISIAFKCKRNGKCVSSNSYTLSIKSNSLQYNYNLIFVIINNEMTPNILIFAINRLVPFTFF